MQHNAQKDNLIKRNSGASKKKKKIWSALNLAWFYLLNSILSSSRLWKNSHSYVDALVWDGDTVYDNPGDFLCLSFE